jgi:hypothetical protein
MLRAVLAVLGMSFLPLTSCSAPVYVQANLQGYGLDPAELGIFRAFTASVAPDSPNPLRDQAVGRLIAAELSARGLENRGWREPSAADEFGFQARLTISESSREVPQQIHVHDSYHAGLGWSWYAPGCDPWMMSTGPGGWYSQTWVSGGYTVHEYSHDLVLQFRDASGREIWRGELTSFSESNDLMAILRTCLPALLAEFPAPSGAPADREIRLKISPE